MCCTGGLSLHAASVIVSSWSLKCTASLISAFTKNEVDKFATFTKQEKGLRQSLQYVIMKWAISSTDTLMQKPWLKVVLHHRELLSDGNFYHSGPLTLQLHYNSESHMLHMDIIGQRKLHTCCVLLLQMLDRCIFELSPCRATVSAKWVTCVEY